MKRGGRKLGSRNKGYFFRTGRGWYTKIAGAFVPLVDEHGEKLRDKTTPAAILKDAVQRAREGAPKQGGSATATLQTDDTTISEICTAYLSQAKATGSPSTYQARAGILFDFCFGLPPRFRPSDDPDTPPKPAPKPSDYLHAGYGQMCYSDLKPIHLDKWLQAHPNWDGGRRTKIQAVKRALNYGVESGLATRNPIRGYRTPKANARVTYITPEQEAELCKCSKSALAQAIKVLIRTGARPGCEFAKLTAKHVKDHGDRMEWIFQPHESKTKRVRTVRITDPAIMEIVREQLATHPSGPIFRNQDGTAWTRVKLSTKFRRVKLRLEKRGMAFDPDCCLYSCRHTYAKRVLQGYWTAKPTNIETLARLMGNSVDVCRNHYLQWTDSYNEPLWESA